VGRDYGFADVVLNGETVKVALFVMTLPYSDAIYMQAFPREGSESFLEGHKRAPAGGVHAAVGVLNSSAEFRFESAMTTRRWLSGRSQGIANVW
jgi:hypothetical protein